MGLIIPSAAAYGRMCKLLLPAGKWRLDPDSYISKLFLGIGDELTRVSGRAADLIEEADPRTTSELLSEFERVLGLSSDGTDDARRARIVARLVQRQGFRPADFQQALALILGQEEEDVVVIERGRVFAVAVGDDQEIFRFFIYRDPADPGSYSIDDAQDVIDLMQPAHAQGHAIEELAFKCDEATSLCDRDLIGNLTPVAVIAMVVATIEGELVIADGRTSEWARSYAWSCTTHPELGLQFTDRPYTTFTAPQVTIFDTVTLQLIVTGYDGTTDTVTEDIIVVDA